MSSPSATQNTYPCQNERTWSRSEKAIGRKILDAAPRRELQDIMQKTKQMMNQIKDPRDVWELERFLTECRKEIDCKYDSAFATDARVWDALE